MTFANVLTDAKAKANIVCTQNCNLRMDATLSRLEKTQQSILDMLSKHGVKQVKVKVKEENVDDESVACGKAMNAVKILHKFNYR